ncbi:MAG: bifunctional 5,10-methylenetetrahydrofolate dehydrogenase/5,10-methenyltetrahydrofolate cyclohydrolase [Candidatus Wildermuthbacteria bacterium]|nr:bifunctional 5,10-methylenetetrahydrofolate dehydrogenase/5,10-methenyltetrahydrofolate cyclohydrolase [Candidatus Wildermuthbacteria bacterium]
MELLSGEPIARRMISDLKPRIGLNLSLSVVQVGENKVSERYIGEKAKVAKELGISFKVARFPREVSQEELEKSVAELGLNKGVSGIIIQLPLPAHLFAQKVLDLIPLGKDVDVLSSANFELFKQGRSRILPPTIEAISCLLQESGVSIQEKNTVIIGKGRLVGEPLRVWFLQKGITPVVADKSTLNIGELARSADILISAAGKAGLITGDMVKEGAVVIDAGTSVESGEAKGDIDFESVSKKAAYITPVPGGVGPLTVANLFNNLVKLSEQ